jgi:LAS superfamily LD-carboxypeptidase LdcB
VAIVVLVLAASLASAGLSANAAESDTKELKELRAEREALAEQIALQAAAVDAVAAEFDEVMEALAVLKDNVEAAEQRLASAQQALDDSRLALESIEAQEVFVQDEMVKTTEGLQNLAVQWYVSGRDTEEQTASISLSTDSPTEAAIRETLFKIRLGQETNLVDRMRELTDDLDLLVENRSRAVSEAQAREADHAARLAEAEAARIRQEEFAAEVEDRLDARLAEAASLEALDSELAQKIRNEERAIAARLAEIARRAELARRATSIPNIVGEGEIVSVGGIRVHQSISQNLANLLSAAAADGILLGGGGYRSSASQIALRRAHCGTSDYDIYQKPSHQCSPPTARPGRSNHERGLAIDFTSNGRAITSRSTSAFQWLSANAARYGFYNLPSEPWHWSVDGN